MEIKILDINFLKKIGVCKDALDFIQRNGLENLNLDDFEIIGDFQNYYNWLKSQKNWEFKFDDNGNKIFHKDSDGNTWEYKYDEKNNKIFEKNSYGYSREFKYDEKNNKIFEKNSYGYSREFKYDERNNLIFEKDSYGNFWECKYFYDEGRLYRIEENGKTILEIKKKI